MKRNMVKIDEEKCNGCTQCIPNCHEGALQMIDNKARLISDLFCDGLGACLGHCPQGAITIEEREAEPYDEKKVMKDNIVPKGVNTIKAHMEHLRDHQANEYLNEAIEYLKENNIKNPMEEVKMEKGNTPCGCSGMAEQDFTCEESKEDENGKRSSQLRQWPVQLHLLNPIAPYFKNADLLLAADCTAYAIADFHKDFIKGKVLAIACPKLDSNQDSYIEKLTSIIDDSNINTLTVAIMEVPCCGGLLAIAKEAQGKAKRKVPIKLITVGIKGNIVDERWE